MKIRYRVWVGIVPLALGAVSEVIALSLAASLGRVNPSMFLGVLLMRSIVSGWIRRIVAREEPFRAIADAAPAMLRVADRDGRCTYLNRGWLDFTGGGSPATWRCVSIGSCRRRCRT